MTFNMNGNDNDLTYRYKVPEFNVTIAGRGNGIYTIFNNIADISKLLNHPEKVILKYIATITGSSYTSETSSIAGTFTSTELKDILLNYIKHLIICPKCGIPETVPKLVGEKKKVSIKLCCSACKNETILTTVNKQIDKGIEIIIKYIKSDEPWVISDSMVKQTVSDKAADIESDDFNPFS
jgi:translation initiation factor 2 beta subunit (eIF-2beta)/eIF-5